MKILGCKELEISGVKVIKFSRFTDSRGYFTEHFRRSDFKQFDFLKHFEIVQANESFSHAGVLRGFHAQWNPYMGKIVRVISGHMVDMFLDIRKGSPTFGKVGLYEMISTEKDNSIDWIWLPPGIAHGNFFLEDTTIEYLCTGEYSPNCEIGINMLSDDIDWSICDKKLRTDFLSIKNKIISDKDKSSISLTQWIKDPRSDNFIYYGINDRILVTGGSGLLGTQLKKILPNAEFPTSSQFDITDINKMEQYLKGKYFNKLIHCAAATSPPKIDQDPIKGLEINIVGTANIVKICKKNNIKLIYISTDYVYDGTKYGGKYSEKDPVNPVNKYSWSKLGGECAVRLYDNHLIIRTTFGPTEFPYPKAFCDQYTSREAVSVIAWKIYKTICTDVTGIINIGGDRKTVLEYANSLDKTKNITGLSINDVNFNVPKDTSMDIALYSQLMKKYY